MLSARKCMRSFNGSSNRWQERFIIDSHDLFHDSKSSLNHVLTMSRRFRCLWFFRLYDACHQKREREWKINSTFLWIRKFKSVQYTLYMCHSVEHLGAFKSGYILWSVLISLGRSHRMIPQSNDRLRSVFCYSFGNFAIAHAVCCVRWRPPISSPFHTCQVIIS